LPVTGLPFTIREIFAISTLFSAPTGPVEAVFYNYSNPSYGPLSAGATLPGTQAAMPKGKSR